MPVKDEDSWIDGRDWYEKAMVGVKASDYTARCRIIADAADHFECGTCAEDFMCDEIRKLVADVYDENIGED